MTRDTPPFRHLVAGLILRAIGLALLGPAVFVALGMMLSH